MVLEKLGIHLKQRARIVAVFDDRRNKVDAKDNQVFE
jgi:hypothetical protein